MTESTVMDKGVEAMTYLKNLMDDQGGYEEAVSFTQALTPGEGLDAFSAGHVGLAMHTNGAYDRYKGQELDFEWDTVIGPHFEGYETPYNYDGGGGLIFFKTGKFDLAWELAEFLLDADVYLEFAELFGMMPARSDVGEEWARLDEGRRVFVNTANTVGWIPIFPGIMEAIGFVADMFNNILINQADIEEELAVVDEKTQELLDNFNSYAVPE
jgi:ABC-type glycerol-3-phosphate transport system substrate-binding protein